MARDKDEVLEVARWAKGIEGFMGALGCGFTVRNPAVGRWSI